MEKYEFEIEGPIHDYTTVESPVRTNEDFLRLIYGKTHGELEWVFYTQNRCGPKTIEELTNYARGLLDYVAAHESRLYEWAP